MSPVDARQPVDAPRSCPALRQPNPQNQKQQHPFLRAFLNPHTYVRYLRARQWDLAKARLMLRATLAWRASYRPDLVSWADVCGEAETGKLFVSPHRDLEGRPVIVMRPRHENSRDRDAQLKLLVYVLEVASRRADERLLGGGGVSGNGGNSNSSIVDAGEAKATILVDFEGYSLSNAPPIRTALATMDILQNHYPERLGRAVCWRAPALFSVTWRAVAPLVDPVTKAKIAFVEDAQAITAHFDQEHVEVCCGGKAAPLFEKGAYGEAMAREDAQRAADVAAAVEAPGCQLSGSDASAASLVTLAASG